VRVTSKCTLTIAKSTPIENVRFGSVAVIQTNTSLMSASEGKADTQKQFLKSPWLNVCFHRKRSFRPPDTDEFEGQLTANSGRWFAARASRSYLPELEPHDFDLSKLPEL
jgi:hypothetical protein